MIIVANNQRKQAGLEQQVDIPTKTKGQNKLATPYISGLEEDMFSKIGCEGKV